MRRPHFNPYLLLALTSLFWAGNMVMSRGLRADLPPSGRVVASSEPPAAAAPVRASAGRAPPEKP